MVIRSARYDRDGRFVIAALKVAPFRSLHVPLRGIGAGTTRPRSPLVPAGANADSPSRDAPMGSLVPGMRTALAGLTIVALMACGDRQPPAIAPQAASVIVVTLKTQTVTLTRELPGRTSPSVVAEVRPQVNGIVKARLFDEGSRVKAGQPLYQLDDAIYRADLATAKASLTRAAATLESARLNAARSAELAKIDAVSRQDNENAIASLRLAEADVAAANAAIQRNEVTLGYARITSPISGRIGKSSVTQGALVTANQTDPLAIVQQLDPIYVDVTQSSAELLELRKQFAAGRLESARDLPVSILLEDGSRYPLQGRLTFADVTVDPATGSFLLRVIVPNPNDILLPGVYLRAVIASGVRQDALLVPQQGVARDPKGDTSVMLVGADGKVEPRSVKVSQAIGDQWLVEEGLHQGDRVIVEGLQKVRPGAEVKATEAAGHMRSPTPQAAAPPGPPAAAKR
jgi:membrane fusion protein (multidrug efflux system)